MVAMSRSGGFVVARNDSYMKAGSNDSILERILSAEFGDITLTDSLQPNLFYP